MMKVPRAERRGPHREAGRASRHQARSQSLSLSDVRRPAAAGLDHARARRRAGDPVSRRAVLGARLRNDACSCASNCSASFMETGTTTVLVSHDLEEAVFLADRVLLLSRHPARVADFTPVAAARPRTDATLSDPEFVRTKAHCLDSVPARGEARMNAGKAQAVLADRRRRRPARHLVAGDVAAMGRSGAAAVADRDIQGRCGTAWTAARSASTSSRPSTGRRHRR